MQKKQLGKSGLRISTLCLGGNVFGWTADEGTSFKLLDAFVDGGGNFIDTADVYSKWVPGNKGGESEAVIGNWLKRSGKRDKVVVATKIGMELAPDKKGLSRTYIQAGVEQSLRRLQTDYIDLYQSHRDDEQTPLDETLRAYSDLITQGKVRAIGASNYSGDRLKQALTVSKEQDLARYESLQPEYNLYDRAAYENDLEPVCLENGLGVIPYFSLAAGFLTGKYRSEADLANRARAGKVKGYLDERGRRILAALDQVSRAHKATPAQVALAWLMARPSITAPIASATSLDQVESLVGAANLHLDRSAIDLLDNASSASKEASA